MSIQNVYIVILNTVYKLTKRISPNAKRIIVTGIYVAIIAFVTIFRFRALYNSWPHNILKIANSIAGCLIILAAGLSIEKEVSVINWRKELAVPYFLFSAGVVLSGIIHPIGDGFMSFGLMLLLAYPPLYIAWSTRKDYEAFYDTISIATLIVGSCYFLYYAALVISRTESISGTRNLGGMANSNFHSFFGVTILCASVYLLYRSMGKVVKARLKQVYCALFIVIGMEIVLSGKSRSAFLIVAASAFSALVLVAKKHLRKKEIRLTKKGTRTVIVFIAVVMIAFSALILDGSILGRNAIKKTTADQISSGRMRLWKSYASELNFTGHNMSTVDWEELTEGIPTRSAHNTFLEYSYRCGIPTGIFSMAFQMVMCIAGFLIVFIKNANRDYELFVVISIIHYTVHSLMDICTISMGSFGALYFYFAVAPFIVEKVSCKQIKKEN